MRLLVFLFLLLLPLAWAQDVHDTYGKTEAEILKMGFQDWMDFYTSKAGNSTADMTEGAGIYGEIAEKRNDRLIKVLKDRPRLLKLRKLMHDFGSASVDVGYAESGGGTMFNTMWASVTGEVEDALYGLMSRSGPKPRPMVVSNVTKQLQKIRKDIEDMHGDDDQFFKYGDAKKALATMTDSFAAIVSIAKHLDRASSDRLLAFCLQEAKLSDFESK